MAHLRLVEPTIDTFGSRRAWKRHRREQHRPSLGAVALASLAIMAAVVLVVLFFSQIASAFVG